MKYQIGQEGQAGGIVFWVNDSDRSLPQAMEAAPRGWYTGVRPWGGEDGDDCQMIWSLEPEGLSEIQFNGKEVGKGPSNHQGIEESSVFCAPKFQVNSFMGDEWMLPTIDELQLMYENLHLQGLGHFDGEQYWSCSVFISPYVYSWNFERGEQMMSFHNMLFSLRPVRQIPWE